MAEAGTGKNMVTKAGRRRSFKDRDAKSTPPSSWERGQILVLFARGEEKRWGARTAPEKTWRSSPSLHALPPPDSDLWRLEVQREKLRSAGHWGEGSRSGVVGVGGGGNDKSPLPVAGATGAPGERERRSPTEGQTPHSVYPVPALQAIPPPLAPEAQMRTGILGLLIIFPVLANWLLDHIP